MRVSIRLILNFLIHVTITLLKDYKEFRKKLNRQRSIFVKYNLIISACILS